MLDFPVDTPACPTCTVHLQEAKRVLNVRQGAAACALLGWAGGWAVEQKAAWLQLPCCKQNQHAGHAHPRLWCSSAAASPMPMPSPWCCIGLLCRA